MIVCSNAGGFTSVLANVQIDDQSVIIRRDEAQRLKVDVGSTCRVLSPRAP